MSRIAAAAPAPAPAADSPPAAPGALLRRIRRIGYAVLGLKLAGFLVWSTLLYQRFALTFDFAQYQQAWFLIAHGHLNPYDTMHRFSFWRNHSEFVMWPLALLYWVWPHGVTLLWLQDIAVMAAEMVALTWICELAERYRPGRGAAWLAAAGLVLLAVNPWTWWAISFDFHMESLAVLFTVLLAWDLANDRRRAWVWVVCALLCGDVAGTYVAGLGLGLMLCRRRSWRRGAVLACLGTAAVLFITLVHGNQGSGHGLAAYSYLAVGAGKPGGRLGVAALAAGIASHPAAVARALWAKRLDIWANLAPSGLLGLAFPLLLPLLVIVLLANSLFHGYVFTEPIFQTLPIYTLLPVATVAVLGWLARRRPRVALVLGCLVVAQALGWAATWAPRTPAQWLRVSGPAAATLARIEARIPPSAEVFASQGVVGRFADRTDIVPIPAPRHAKVQRQVWFVIAPLAGVEKATTGTSMAVIGQLADQLHATLVVHADGVWAFRWDPPPGVRTVTVPDGLRTLPAWAGPGTAGRAVLTGPASGWHATSTGSQGYVADGLAWQRPPGQYRASVTLSSTGPVNIEVWNDTGNVLLARLSIPATNGIERVNLPVDAAAAYPDTIFSGWGPFRARFGRPPLGQRLEVRVWSPGAETVNVYSASLTRAS
jgi:Predicted membrane protein (DUF2079)